MGTVEAVSNGNLQLGSSLKGNLGIIQKLTETLYKYFANQKAKQSKAHRHNSKITTLHKAKLSGWQLPIFFPWFSLFFYFLLPSLYLTFWAFSLFHIHTIWLLWFCLHWAKTLRGSLSLSLCICDLCSSPCSFTFSCFCLFFDSFSWYPLEFRGFNKSFEEGKGYGSSKTRRDKSPTNGSTSRFRVLYWL